MKKLTLEKTWEECLRMWKWIIEQVNNREPDDRDYIEDLKAEWMKENSYKSINSTCFFCHYADLHESRNDVTCSKCPGVLVSPRFSCLNSSYTYDAKPKKFYKKLLALNKKRLEKK